MKTKPICKIKMPGIKAKHREVVEREFSKYFVGNEKAEPLLMDTFSDPSQFTKGGSFKIKGKLTGIRPFDKPGERN